ncbi:mucin-21 [Rhagoletis pomonella]|uniref:mucin-21 n=1 Tax=Rhagoletis pomonella TaxID=28610 RepID=UPI00177ACC32|nr:mucin-21 [Rhagoletis pomonella]
MQLNLNAVADDEDDEDVVAYDAPSSEGFDDTRLAYNALGGFNDMDLVGAPLSDENKQRQQGTISKENGDNLQQLNGNAAKTDNSAALETLSGIETVAGTAAAAAAAAASNEHIDYKINKPHKSNLRKTLAMRTFATTAAIAGKTAKTNKADGRADDSKSENSIVNDEMMRTFEGNLRVNEETFFSSGSTLKLDDDEQSINGNESHGNSKSKSRRQHKRRKPTKNYSTMFCEGYNIEQRNCNTFECSDDISDLLKFYKKFSLPEDVASPATVAMQSSPLLPLAADSHIATTTLALNSVMPSIAVTTSSAGAAATVDSAGNATTIGATSATDSSTGSGSETSASSASVRAAHIAGTASGAGTSNSNAAASIATVANPPPSTTPANMGCIRYWRNPLNFTIMLTLRVRYTKW